jgi:RNA polymerase sigma-70 factor (ECF subfamily)
MADIAQLLSEMRKGSDNAASALLAQAYDELHRLASSYMRRERPDHTLQTTALVHEAYIRMIGQRELDWSNQAQLLGLAAQAMRRVLTDHSRARLTAKRGGLCNKISLEENAVPAPASQPAELLAIDEALSRLAMIDPRQSKIVELRFFGGLSVETTARILGISPRTVKRDWMVAKAWLHGELAKQS